MDFSSTQLWLIGITVGAGLATALYMLMSSDNGENHGNKEEDNRPEPPKLRRLPVGRMTKEEIAKNKGDNDSRILTSICGRIFDCSAGRDFYGPGGPYSCFIGGDSSYMLGAMSLNEADINKTDFEVDGEHQVTLGDWIARFRQKYPIVGRLDGFEHLCPASWDEAGTEDGNVKENDNIVNGKNSNNNKLSEMSLSDLAGCGNNYLSVCGYIFNVTGAEYVYAPFYGDFAGAIRHDISVAIGKNAFADENYNKPLSLLNNDNDKQRLLKMFQSFVETYPIVGKLSDKGFEVDSDSDEWSLVNKSSESSTASGSGSQDAHKL